MKITVTVKPATLAQAKKITEDLRQDFQKMKHLWFDVGKKVSAALRAEVPKALGLTLDNWILQWAEEEDASGKVSTIKDSVRIIRALEKLPENTVRNLPKVNALNLAMLPESKRLDPDWVRKARNSTARDFKAAVDKVRGVKASPREDDDQEFRNLKVEHLPKETFEQFITFRDRMARLCGCSDDKKLTPWILAGAFLAMIEQNELEEFYEGVSRQLAAD